MCVRPLRADECLPVLTHRHVPDVTSKTDDDKDTSASQRRRKDSHRHSEHRKKDRKVCSQSLVSLNNNNDKFNVL